jgi:phospholipase/carboxylesterase
MKGSAQFVTTLALLLCLIGGTAHAQCQLAFNEEQNQVVDPETLLDLTIFDNIDPASEQFTDFPVCNLQLLRTYAYGLFETGEYELQSRIYTYILRHERDITTLYNLACCFSRMGMPDKTLEYLEYAFNYGYENLDWVEQDTDMDIIRGLPRYPEIMAQQRERIAAQEEARQSVEINYVECPSVLQCQVVLPENFNPESSHTLVIGLHGAGDTADRFSTLSGYFGENDFIYAAPQAPFAVPFPDGGYVWFSELQDGNDELNRQSRDMLVAYIDNVIAEMQSQYLIDQIYLVGFSQGAAVSYISGISRPGIIDGIVVFGGGLDPAWFTNDELSAASGLRVFIAHGSEDNIENAQQARDLLTEAGFEVDFNEFPGGHFIHLDTLHEAFGWISE